MLIFFILSNIDSLPRSRPAPLLPEGGKVRRLRGLHDEKGVEVHLRRARREPAEYQRGYLHQEALRKVSGPILLSSDLERA